MISLTLRPLTREAFAPFGQVLDHVRGDIARRNFAAELFNGRAGARPNLRVQRSRAAPLPLVAKLIERHRHSSQMFAPISGGPYLVLVVASNPNGMPDFSRAFAFAARGDQAINYNRGTWHHAFTALQGAGTFLMLRWEDGSTGDEEFLELPVPYQVETEGLYFP